MKLELEAWLSTQSISLEAASCFNESFICFKASAYKAALLFAYIGFMNVVRDRILQSQGPVGIAEAHWNSIQNNVRDAETWDRSVFDFTQQKSPAPIFTISDDLRSQIKFWKDRRNDCAHSKANKITVAYVEAFYAFVESNLNKLIVNGSRNEMMSRILNYFDPSLTPPNTPLQPIIYDLPNAVMHDELPSFLVDLFQHFDKQR